MGTSTWKKVQIVGQGCQPLPMCAQRYPRYHRRLRKQEATLAFKEQWPLCNLMSIGDAASERLTEVIGTKRA
jgi:hypothetical protein